MGERLTARRTSAGTAAAMGWLLLAGLLVAGCAHAPARPRQGSVSSCVQVSIGVIRRRVTLTALPPACRGLTREQLALAANAAGGVVAGSGMHGKRLMRARMRELSPLLPRLPRPAPARRSQSLSTPTPSQPPLGLAALAAWTITVGLGLLMMARWLTRPARAGRSGPGPAMNLAHLGLAVAGLAAWTGHLATGSTALAWIACVLLLPTAGLGMSLLVLRPGRALAARSAPVAQAVPVGAGAPAPVGSHPPPARRPRVLVATAHVAFAVATMLLSLLATVGAG